MTNLSELQGDKGCKGGARADAPGSREPSPEGLGPTGFDPSRDMIWPFGHGVVATAPAYPLMEGSDAAVLYIRAVPNEYIVPREEWASTAVEAWEAAVALGGPVTALTFKDAAAIERLRTVLAELASGIEARSDTTGTGVAEGESPSDAQPDGPKS